MATGHREIRRQILTRMTPRPRVFLDRENPLETLSEEEVFFRYRFRPIPILFIVELIHESLLHETRRGCSLPSLLQVLLCMRFLATGAFQQLVDDSISISQPTVSRVIRRVTRALLAFVKQFISFPTGESAVNTKKEFAAIAGFPNVVGCVDGTFVKIKRPRENEADFLNRKGFHSLNVQVICDAHLRVISLNAMWPGSVHDARIWKSCALRQQFENGVHDGLLLGDSGYPCRKYLMTPYLQPSLPCQEKSNRCLCRTRVLIEQTFGVLKARFACLKFGVESSPTTAVDIITACVILHNIGINRKDVVDVEFD